MRNRNRPKVGDVANLVWKIPILFSCESIKPLNYILFLHFDLYFIIFYLLKKIEKCCNKN